MCSIMSSAYNDSFTSLWIVLNSNEVQFIDSFLLCLMFFMSCFKSLFLPQCHEDIVQCIILDLQYFAFHIQLYNLPPVNMCMCAVRIGKAHFLPCEYLVVQYYHYLWNSSDTLIVNQVSAQVWAVTGHNWVPLVYFLSLYQCLDLVPTAPESIPLSAFVITAIQVLYLFLHWFQGWYS